MDKIVAVWTGWSGGPGFSNFYFGGNAAGSQLDSAAARVHAFFSAITLCLPTPITITIQPTAQNLTPGDGQISDEKPIATPGAPIVGAGGTDFASPVGACIIWRTGTTVNGRLLKGKTFLVPLATSVYDVDGTLDPSRLTELRQAATQLATSPGSAPELDLVVWHRPVAGSGGSMAPVISATVNDRAAILKSRRA